MNYLDVPKSVIKKLGRSFNQRLICTVNKRFSWPCGLVALGNGHAYISLNRKILKKLGVSTGAEVNVALEKDTSKYGMTMP